MKKTRNIFGFTIKNRKKTIKAQAKNKSSASRLFPLMKGKEPRCDRTFIFSMGKKKTGTFRTEEVPVFFTDYGSIIFTISKIKKLDKG